MRPLDTDGVADAGQHVGDWISEHIRRLSPNNSARNSSVHITYSALVPYQLSCLPTSFANAGDQTLVRQFTKTDSADAELAVHGPWAAAHRASPLEARCKFRH